MRLIYECTHGTDKWCGRAGMREHDIAGDPDAILAALAEAGVLEVDELFARKGPSQMVRYTSPWKEAK